MNWPPIIIAAAVGYMAGKQQAPTPPEPSTPPPSAEPGPGRVILTQTAARILLLLVERALSSGAGTEQEVQALRQAASELKGS